MHPAILISLIIVGAAALVALAVALLRLYMLMPAKRNGEMKKYIEIKYAHRGLHDATRAENSLSAFRAAKEHGFGMEFDLRLSKDGVLVVCHDASLKRVAGIDKRVSDMTVEELASVRLGSTDDYVPTFREVLELIDGAVPLLIELKQAPDEAGVGEQFIKEIEGYKGDFIVESFNPGVLRTVSRARPDILIGILSYDYTKDENYKDKLIFRLLGKLYLNFLARPDFISYEKSGAAVPTMRFIRRKYDTPLVAWTITSPEEERKAYGDGFDTVIFEGYIPEK